MKQLWDQIHPEFPDLSSKYLRTQVTRIITKKLIRETQDQEFTNPNQQQQGNPEQLEPATTSDIIDESEESYSGRNTVNPIQQEVFNKELDNLRPSRSNDKESLIPEGLAPELQEKWKGKFLKICRKECI